MRPMARSACISGDARQQTRSVQRDARGDVASAETRFRRAHPGYAGTSILDELRASDYARLENTGQVYLDYTGGGLYADSQLREHFELLRTGVFGNPHSVNPSSAASTELAERARS
jgi:molybdenum cofactor sulfurtransferase